MKSSLAARENRFSSQLKLLLVAIIIVALCSGKSLASQVKVVTPAELWALFDRHGAIDS
jgi:hypothetical protein